MIIGERAYFFYVLSVARPPLRLFHFYPLFFFFNDFKQIFDFNRSFGGLLNFLTVVFLKFYPSGKLKIFGSSVSFRILKSIAFLEFF